MADSSYLIFTLQEAQYAADADAVLEIFSLPELAPAPQAPPDVVGLIDLRGSIVPVVDLRLRFGLSRRRYTISDSVVVFAYEGRMLGLIIDDVHEVRRIGAYEMQPAPEYGDALHSGERYVTAMASVAGTITAILNLERLFRNLPAEMVPGAGDGRSAPALSGFQEQIDPADLEVFRERADRLRERARSADPGSTTSLAVIVFGDELFGIGLDAVREFAECSEVAAVPCSPGHIVGLTNLRGDILTLVDIRGILGISTTERTRGWNVVVVQSGEGRIGIAVDDIQGVIHVPSEEILRARRPGRNMEGDQSPGSILHAERVVTLLDIPSIIASGALHVEEEVGG